MDRGKSLKKKQKCRSYRTGMNEWSPKGYYSGSTTTDIRPPVHVYRQYWKEGWDQDKYNANWTNMNSYKIDCLKPCEITPDFNEDLGIPPTNSSKKTKNGASDPRFKKVINTEFRGESDMEAEKLASTPKMSLPSYNQATGDRILNEKTISFLKSPNNDSTFTSSSLKTIDDGKGKDVLDEVTKDPGFQPSDKYYSGCNLKTYRCDHFQKPSHIETFQELDKVKSNVKVNLKRSTSDCTLQTKNAFDRENDDEVCEKVRAYPSATKLSKVRNWIKEYNILPEKKRSVITVIGQTQTKPLSKILNEINQRRKLAKELDKHALCEAIMGSAEGQTDVKNLVAKVDLVLPDGKVIYSTEKVYLCKDNKYTDTGEYSQKSLEILDADQKRKICEMIPERDSSVSQLGKKNKTKRFSKKLVTSSRGKQEAKDSLKNILESTSSLMFWSVLVIVFFCLFSFFFYTIRPSQTSLLADFFKPKTAAWYEKLLF